MAISRNLPQTYTADLTFEAVYKDKVKTISLSDYANKYVVLIFYPYDFTIVCPTEINAISDSKSKFEDVNSVVLFVSCDSIYCHQAWMKVSRSDKGIKGCTWPVISDYDRSLSQYFNICEPAGNCARATIILDKKRNLVHFSVGDNRMGRNVDEILRTLQMANRVEKTGEMCECNWKK
ncbi:hypothetical protein VCUG_00155 [Vavraia culicis subsp. floridensis]|uniref:Thioredoxin domain-containing protein n=1 Tax=Vavraia culicis (isolate floridensis) TaxID=948595 RepID=L2GXF7_VAVCU|nr:uncharacterized protein VCUG_00155 [Vavraia culicis subsp. floridensis]ELA48319.1 hypothetical protein VCUG_00155 [Vavraia culicis subsp. floridensis]